MSARPRRPPRPQGIPAQLAAQLDRVGTAVFQHGYVRAMHPTLILPIVAMFVAAALCLLVTRHVSGAVGRTADRAAGCRAGRGRRGVLSRSAERRPKLLQ